MTDSSRLHATNHSNLQRFVFGLSPVVNFDSNIGDPLEFLKLSAAAPRIDLLAYEARKATLTGLPAGFVNEVAANGFALANSVNTAEQDTSPLTLVCVVCSAKFTAHQQLIDSYDDEGEDVVDGTARFRHRLGCQYRRLYNLCLSDPNRRASTSSPVTQRLTDHLRREMATSKALVAREFSYEEDAICTAMGVRYLNTGESYPDAGSLVDDLTELIVERGGAEPLSVISGLADFVTGSSSGPQSMPGPSGLTYGPGQESLRTQAATRPPASHQSPPAPNNTAPSASAQSSSPAGSRSLLEETISLYARTLCRRCRKQKAQYVALPCGHLSLCPGCAAEAAQCPSCELPLRELVKTFGT